MRVTPTAPENFFKMKKNQTGRGVENNILSMRLKTVGVELKLKIVTISQFRIS